MHLQITSTFIQVQWEYLSSTDPVHVGLWECKHSLLCLCRWVGVFMVHGELDYRHYPRKSAPLWRFHCTSHSIQSCICTNSKYLALGYLPPLPCQRDLVAWATRLLFKGFHVNKKPGDGKFFIWFIFRCTWHFCYSFMEILFTAQLWSMFCRQNIPAWRARYSCIHF